MRSQNRAESRANFPTQKLFSDAEVGEDVGEDFVGGDLAAGDFGKDGKGLAEVFAEEVAGEACLHAFNDALRGLLCAAEDFVVAGLGDNDAVFRLVGQVGSVVNGLSQCLNVDLLLGADAEHFSGLQRER